MSTNNQPASSPTPPARSDQYRWTRRVLIFLACPALSILAALVTTMITVLLINAGYFTRWQRLPDLPVTAHGLSLSKSDGRFTVHAQLSSGETYNLPFGAATWSSGDAPPANIAVSCAGSLPALAWTTKPPNGLTSCIQYLSRGADCERQWAFALDGDGRPWQWAIINCASGTLGVAAITFVASGLTYLTLSLSLAALWLRRRAY